MQARIAMLKRRMNEIALMNIDRIPHGKAGFGSTVTLREATGRESSISSSCPRTPTPRRA